MFNNLTITLMMLPGILLAISVHEFSHALAAVKLGDNTPIIQGRLTVNPLKHIDPFGFFSLLFFGFGWAKPVMINSRNFKNPRRDDTIVSFAGPLSNFITAVIFAYIIAIFQFFLPTLFTFTTRMVLEFTVYFNLILMVFNLIPIPPLDGHHILGNIVGAPMWNFYYKYYDHLRFLMLILIVFRITGRIIRPIVGIFENLVFYIVNMTFLFFR